MSNDMWHFHFATFRNMIGTMHMIGSNNQDKKVAKLFILFLKSLSLSIFLREVCSFPETIPQGHYRCFNKHMVEKQSERGLNGLTVYLSQ